MENIDCKSRELMSAFRRTPSARDDDVRVESVSDLGGLDVCGTVSPNGKALGKYRLNQRVLHGVATPATAVNILGMDLSMPILGASLRDGVRDAGGCTSETGYALTLLTGCAARGVVGCTGDGVFGHVFEAGLDALHKSQCGGVCFVNPWEGPELYRRIERAEAAGATVVGLEADAVGLAESSHAGLRMAPLSLARLTRVIRRASVPFAVKGIMTPDEAVIAVEAGADAVVVSNRGGRALGNYPGVAEVLPWIVEAVHGQAVILVEGGVRSGADVLKLLALGANAVLIGRPLEVVARSDGRRGVEECLDRFRRELEQAMLMTGAARAASVNRSVLYTPR